MTVQRVSEEYEEISAFVQQSRLTRRYDKTTMTFSVSFREIIDHSPQLYEKLMDQPVKWLSAFQRYVRETCDQKAQLLLTGEPVASRRVSPRQLNASGLCRLWAVSGVVTKAAPPVPTLRTLVTYDSTEKRHITSEYADPRLSLGVSSTTVWLPRDADVIREYGLSNFGAVQEVTIQDDAASVPQGRAPVALQVLLLDSLVDSCKAGDYVEIVGTLLPSRGSGLLWEYRSPQLQAQIGQFLLAVSVKQADRQLLDEKTMEIQADAGETLLQSQAIQSGQSGQTGSDGAQQGVSGATQKDLQLMSQILSRQHVQVLKAPSDVIQAFLSTCQNASPSGRSKSLLALELLGAAIAPGVYGHSSVKRALVLQQLGGQSRVKTGTRTRGDINVLLIGAPGCGKSQLLRAALGASLRGLSASGRGASGAGLTAAVTVDRQGNRTLSAGAFVLADGGLLAIDEFDKLQVTDRSAVHEAMEQQTVSVSKAGVHVSLNARTAVLAAANCVYGDFQEELSLRDNLNLPESILSRFDLVFRIRDLHENDPKIASFVLRNHQFAQAGSGDRFQTSGGEDDLQNHEGDDGRGHRDQSDIFQQIPRELFQPYNSELHGATLRHLQSINANSDVSIHAEKFLLRREVFRTLIAFCKAGKAPSLTPGAASAAAVAYASLRKDAPQEVLVTVRALESLIRLSTALARLSWPPRDVTAADVAEAHALLRVGLFGDSERDAASAAKLPGMRRRGRESRSQNRSPEFTDEEEDEQQESSSEPAKKRGKNAKKAQKKQNVIEDDLEDPETQQLSEEERERLKIFWQAFDDIVQERGGQQITIANLQQQLNVWTTERAVLNIQQFSLDEINKFLKLREGKDNGIVIESGVIYF